MKKFLTLSLFIVATSSLQAMHETSCQPLSARKNMKRSLVPLDQQEPIACYDEIAKKSAKRSLLKTPLQSFFDAVKQGDFNKIKPFLADSIDINSQNNNGTTALSIAVKNSHPELVAFLINNGANVNCRNRSGSTPLHSAVRAGLTTIVEKLLNAQANLKLKNSQGKTALTIAKEYKRKSLITSLWLAEKRQKERDIATIQSTFFQEAQSTTQLASLLPTIQPATSPRIPMAEEPQSITIKKILYLQNELSDDITDWGAPENRACVPDWAPSNDINTYDA